VPKGPHTLGPPALPATTSVANLRVEDPIGEREPRMGTIPDTWSEGAIEQAETGQAGTVSRLTSRLGFWSGSWAAAAAVGFPLAVLIAAVAFPQPAWTGDAAGFAAAFTHPWAWSVGEVFSLLIIPGWVGLAVAIHTAAPQQRRPFSLAGLVLTGAYVATVGANDLIQITTVRLNLTAGTTEGLAVWIKDNPHSLFYPLETIGYLWQALAALLAAAVLTGPGIRRWIRWLFGAVAVSGVWGLAATVLGLGFQDPFFLAGMALYAVAFPLGAALCAVVFRRLGQATTAAGQAAERAPMAGWPVCGRAGR
jgi:MFS family permease